MRNGELLITMTIFTLFSAVQVQETLQTVSGSYGSQHTKLLGIPSELTPEIHRSMLSHYFHLASPCASFPAVQRPAWTPELSSPVPSVMPVGSGKWISNISRRQEARRTCKTPAEKSVSFTCSFAGQVRECAVSSNAEHSRLPPGAGP